MTEVHPLCCDCCSCLNGSGGLVLPDAGVTVEEPGAAAVRAGRRAAEAAQRRWLAKKARVA